MFLYSKMYHISQHLGSSFFVLQVIDSNVRTALLADTIPKINLSDPLNGYVLDFYNHGLIIVVH